MKMKCKYSRVYMAGALIVPPLEAEKFKDGEMYNVDVSRPRSKVQHDLFFAAMAVAFMNWPEHHYFKPLDEKHLRYWLECKALWGSTILFEDPSEAVKFMSRQYGKPCFATEQHGQISVFVPDSIAYGKMGKVRFQEFVNAIDEVLYHEAGFGLTSCKRSALTDAK